MDALLSRSGILDAKTDLRKAEVYLLAEPGTRMTYDEVRREIEGDFGYGVRSFQRSTELKWEELGRANR
jgi:hypothetical protein